MGDENMFLPLLVAIAASSSVGRGADDSAYIGLFAETHLSRIAGMKMKEMPKLPPGIKLPASVMAMMPGPPSRTLKVRLWAPGIAPDSATASITPPAGLQAGDKLDLSLYRPMPTQAGTGGSPNEPSHSDTKPPDLTIKIYWGSSDTVQAGQPKVFTLATMGVQQQMEMSKRMMASMPKMGGGGAGAGGGANSYFYKDNWTTGYWPSADESVGENASLVGNYTIDSTFAGKSSIEAPANVDFLAPFDLTSPDLGEKPVMANAMKFEWKEIPNAIGTFASAMGVEGKNTLIFWTCSQDYAEQLMSNMDFMQMSEVKDMVNKHVFMPGSGTSVTIPAGIFANAQFASVNMVGYGPGVARDDVKPIPRIQTKTTLSVMLMGAKRGGE